VRRPEAEQALALGAAAVVLCAGLATTAFAHPSPAETAERRRAQALCVQPVAEAERLDPARLGESEALLRSAFGDALADAGGGASRRLTRRLADSDVASIDYDLHGGRVYRIRWRLAERFEAPVLATLRVQAVACLGDPAYDQTIEPKAIQGKPVVRRIGWNHGAKRIELRQVHPLTGGPVYLSVADRAALDAALKDEAEAMAEPTAAEPWWQKPRMPHIPDEAERRRLADAFGSLLAQVDH